MKANAKDLVQITVDGMNGRRYTVKSRRKDRVIVSVNHKDVSIKDTDYTVVERKALCK